jgi:hypothetical protein
VSDSPTVRRRLAQALLRQTAWILPKQRRPWAEAMLSELHHLGNDREALRWSVSCLIAGIKERVHAMITGNLKIARWVLIPEMLLCFAPTSIGWWDATFGDYGVVGLNADIIHRYFAGASGTTALVWMISAAIVEILGPVGLIAAARLIMLRRAMSRTLGAMLIIGPIIHLGFSFTRFIISPPLLIAALDEVILFGLLPLAGALHLAWLGSHESPTPIRA